MKRPLPLKKQISILKYAREKVIEINIINQNDSIYKPAFLCNIIQEILPEDTHPNKIYEYIPLFNNANARIWANGKDRVIWFSSNHERLRFLEILINKLEAVQLQRKLVFKRRLWRVAHIAAFIVGIMLGRLIEIYFL